MFGFATNEDIRFGERFVKSFVITFVWLIGLLPAIVLLTASSAYGQDAKLQLNDLDKLASKAAESIDINLDGSLLTIAGKALSSERSPEEATIKELIKDLTGVYVKRFEFDNEGEYGDSDIEPLRSQLKAPGWSRIVGVKSKRGSENIEVYTMTEGERMLGLAIVATQPKEMTIVNIVGSLDLEKLIEVARYFGMPGLELPKVTKPGKD